MSAYDSAPPAGDDFDRADARRDSPRRSAAPEDSLAPPTSSYRDRSSGRSRSPDNWRVRAQPAARPSREASSRALAAPTDPPKSEVLGVFGLSVRTREMDLEDEFGRYGRVVKVTIVYDQRSDRSRGFGFVTMSTVEEAQECINHLSGMDLNGRKIRVDFSITTKPHQSTPGEYMGIKRREYDEPQRDAPRGYDRYDRNDRYDDRRTSRYDDRDRAYSRRDDYERSGRDDYGRSSRDDYGRSSRDDYGRSSRDDYGRSSRDAPRSPRRESRRSPSPPPRKRSYSRSPNPSASSRRSPLPPRDYDDAIDSASAPATRW